MTLVLALRHSPPQRINCSALVPHRLAGLTSNDIAKIEIGTTREKLCVGDLFVLTYGTPDHIVFEGGSERLDFVGEDLAGGTIVVKGDVGMAAGRLMKGGVLQILRDAGPYAGSGMEGGSLKIGGDAGERLGGPMAGEMHGMAGGVLVVRGAGGARAGDRMRRGTMTVEGAAGEYAGCRMIAGTLIVLGAAGALPGYLQQRGTIVLGTPAQLPPTFSPCGAVDPVFLRVMANWIAPESAAASIAMQRSLARYAGDQAVLGKGEIWLAG